MNILLARPRYPYVHASSFKEKSMPVGIGFLMSILREAGHRVSFIDRYLTPETNLSLDLLRSQRIDLVGLSLDSITLRNALHILETLQYFRQRGLWKGLLVVGGPHASIKPDSIPDYVDYVVIGEGEYALRDIANGNSCDRIIRSPRIKNLDELPFPAYDVFFSMGYDSHFTQMENSPSTNMSTSRGCPFNCRFCSVDVIWGRKYTCFSAERVYDDMQRLRRDFGINSIVFREDNFLANHSRIVKLGEMLCQANRPLVWSCEVRISDLQDEGFVQMLHAAGCVNVFLGIESLSDHVLGIMHKKITVADIERALAICRKHEIIPFGSFIIGVPGETEEDRRATIEGAQRLFLNPDDYRINVFLGIPENEMYREALQSNQVDYQDPVTGFFYIKEHDALSRLTLPPGRDLYLHRRSPRSFMESPDNINHAAVSFESWEERIAGKSGLEIHHPANATGKSSQLIPFRNLLSLLTELEREKTYEYIVLNNIWHLIPPESLSLVLNSIRKRLQPNGILMGYTMLHQPAGKIGLDGIDIELGGKIMQHYFAEYLYSEEELRSALSSSGFKQIRFCRAENVKFSFILAEPTPPASAVKIGLR